ncbi:quinone oxidoreductase [Lentzea sp. NBRC 105346]|uniref:quinone oxidoreductase family protein n=1 Tax=Lentzea sp. NBRC 105346 TaxID=3032205 RepID=UPI0024A0E8D0|nr:quinone oxidoreductase [Lentzea sp. NBRC 105346]GLZ28779.1 quinone oxidoreductase [Lentzea sp. NBRC 105346]
MTKAVVARAAGGPEVLEYTDVSPRSLESGELRVRVSAAGVNFIDTYQRSGLYSVPLPAVLGLEGAGEVVESASPDFAVGDRVAWMSSLGSYAAEAIVSASVAVPVPSGVDDETAAAALLQGVTAHYLLHSTFSVSSGQTVLVHAAAGGMGLLLTQWATALGARVIGTASTDEKADLARAAGATDVFKYGDFAGAVRSVTDGRGVDVVYDGVGKDTFDGSLASLRPRGLLALYGAASGPVPPFDLQRLNQSGGLFVTRPSTVWYTQTRDELEWRARDVYAAIADGTLSIRVGGRYKLEEARQAHEDLEGRRTTGKLLLVP